MYTLPNDGYTLQFLRHAAIITAKSAGFKKLNQDVINCVAHYALDFSLSFCRRASRHSSYLHKQFSIDDLEFAGVDLNSLRYFTMNVPPMEISVVPKYSVKPKTTFINNLNIPGLPPHAIETLKDLNLYVEPSSATNVEPCIATNVDSQDEGSKFKTANKKDDNNNDDDNDDDDDDMLMEAINAQERESRIVWPDNPDKEYPSLLNSFPLDLNASLLEDPFLRRLHVPRPKIDDMALAVQTPEVYFRAEYQKALASRKGPNYNWADNASSSDEDTGFTQKTVISSPSNDPVAVVTSDVSTPEKLITLDLPRKSPGFLRKYPPSFGVSGRGIYKTKRMDSTGSNWVARPHSVKGNVVTLMDGKQVFVGDLTSDEINETNTEIIIKTSKFKKRKPIKLRLFPPK